MASPTGGVREVDIPPRPSASGRVGLQPVQDGRREGQGTDVPGLAQDPDPLRQGAAERVGGAFGFAPEALGQGDPQDVRHGDQGVQAGIPVAALGPGDGVIVFDPVMRNGGSNRSA